MLNFGKKRKEAKLQKECFEVIKENLSDKFRFVDVARFDNLCDLSDMILYGNKSKVKARIDKSNAIHIRIEDLNGFVFEAFTTNYKWFLSTFSF